MSFSGTKGYIVKPKPGVMLNPLHPLSRGLVGYWLFNEGSGSRANDISGKGNHGTLMNMSPNAQNSGWGGSKFGGGLNLDGTNDYIEIPSGIGSYITNACTIMAKVKVDTTHADRFVIWDDFKYTVPKDKALHLRINTNETIRLSVSDNGTDDDYVETTDTIDGNHHDIIATFSLGDVVIYIDGIESITDTLTKTSIHDTGLSKYIGTYYHASEFAKGSTGFVQIYNRALSAVEAKQLHHNPFCNLLQVPIRRYSVAAPPVGAIMNQFQRANIGADLYNGVFA